MEAVIEEASEWIQSSPKNYKYDLNDHENTIKFTFSSDTVDAININVTFEDDKFSVWSETEDFLPYLNQVIDFCDSQRDKNVIDILDRIDEAVEKYLKSCVEEEEMDDDDDCMDNYYDHDEDAIACDTMIAKKDSDEVEDEEEENFFGSQANPAAFQRLTKDLRNMRKEAHKFGILGKPRGDNIFIWDVKLTGFSEDTKLGKDLKKFAENHKREPVVYLEMQFPGDYPMAPPFVRVIRPRFKFLTGHVTIGGSICMEMLTRSGWRPTNDIESILVQIRCEIMSDPNARLDANPDREYGEAEARDAFNRMVSRYGWNK